MSGHSKWATTKYRKAAQDKARGKLFAKLIREIEVAAREGGGDLDGNPALRNAFNKARDASVPMETIERAIKRGTGELEGVRYEHVSYEGYGPCGVGFIVECLTDNRNRTGAEIKNIFSKNGGSLAEKGAVAWQFSRKGVVRVDPSADEDSLVEAAAEAGADDFELTDDAWVITCAPERLTELRQALEKVSLNVLSAELALVPSQTIEITNDEDAKKVLRLLEALEDHDDVQNVYDNASIREELVAALT